MMLARGTRVVIEGLVARPELNGRFAVVEHDFEVLVDPCTLNVDVDRVGAVQVVRELHVLVLQLDAGLVQVDRRALQQVVSVGVLELE